MRWLCCPPKNARDSGSWMWMCHWCIIPLPVGVGLEPRNILMRFKSTSTALLPCLLWTLLKAMAAIRFVPAKRVPLYSYPVWKSYSCTFDTWLGCGSKELKNQTGFVCIYESMSVWFHPSCHLRWRQGRAPVACWFSPCCRFRPSGIEARFPFLFASTTTRCHWNSGEKRLEGWKFHS